MPRGSWPTQSDHNSIFGGGFLGGLFFICLFVCLPRNLLQDKNHLRGFLFLTNLLLIYTMASNFVFMGFLHVQMSVSQHPHVFLVLFLWIF